MVIFRVEVGEYLTTTGGLGAQLGKEGGDHIKTTLLMVISEVESKIGHRVWPDFKFVIEFFNNCGAEQQHQFT